MLADPKFAPNHQGLSLSVHMYGKTIKLISGIHAKPGRNLDTEEKGRRPLLLRNFLASDTHFEVIKANT